MVHDEYTCLRCGEKLIARRCKIQCPRCGYTEDCADAGLIDYDRQKRFQRGPVPAPVCEAENAQPLEPTSRRYKSNSD